MSTLNPTKKISRRQELREDKVITLYAKAWEFFDENKALVRGVLVAIVVVALAMVAWGFYQDNRAVQADALMGAPVKAYEAGNYREALDGTPDSPGLLMLADDYGSTKAGNLARFYAADALYRLGEFDEALGRFEAYDKSENYIGASAFAGQAAIYENKEDFKRAGDLYRRAALFFESEVTSPQYLYSAGQAYEHAARYDDAHEAFLLIQERYPDSALARNIDVDLARVEARRKAS